jgi:hypothetical protein
MPRLSLFRPEKGNDYKFIDRQISEMFQIGGTDVYLHKYLGPKNPDEADATADQPHYDVVKETNIQDLLFLENRDRKYSEDIYRIRGHYQVQDIDFNLSQFGLFLDNDMVYMTVHINNFVSTVGRKPLAGDVFEFLHLKDEYALNEFDTAMPRYFVIEDVGRAAEGFSATWWPHLYRLKLKKISDSQQYADILNRPADQDANFVGDFELTATYLPGQIVRYEGILYTVTSETTGNLPTDTNYFSVYSANTIESIISTNAKNLQINDAILSQAEANTPKSGYETQQFYTLAVDQTTGNTLLTTVDNTEVNVSQENSNSPDASSIHPRPQRSGYTGYLLGDGIPDNGVEFGHGIAFPTTAQDGDFFLRTDFFPNRLFRFNGATWVKKEDAVRHTLTNTDSRSTLRTSFINNTNSTVINNEVVEERQSLSKALKPKADF